MNQALVDQIASAVLYEGYILYPYRPSVKNRQRWTFGGLVPREFSQAQGETEPWEMQTECLVRAAPARWSRCRCGFLQLVARLVGQFPSPTREWPAEGAVPCQIVECLRVGDEVFYTWQEAVEQAIDLGESSLAAPGGSSPQRRSLCWNPQRDRQPLRDPAGCSWGPLFASADASRASSSSCTTEVHAGVFRVTVKIQNQTPLETRRPPAATKALMQGLVSTHTVLVDSRWRVRLDDRSCRGVRELAAAMPQRRLLAGAGRRRGRQRHDPVGTDHPLRLSPDRTGEPRRAFDGTEIDEILTLRIMTLTDDEKAAMAAVDERARAVLARTESLGKEQMLGLHGTFRGLQPLVGRSNIMDNWDPTRGTSPGSRRIRVVGVDYTGRRPRAALAAG